MNEKDNIRIEHLLDASFNKIYSNIEQLFSIDEKNMDYKTYLNVRRVKIELLEELKALEFLYKGSFKMERRRHISSS